MFVLRTRMIVTMKSTMKAMKKAVVDFRISCMSVLTDVAVQPFRHAQLFVWPKAKSLHELHGRSSGFY